MKKTLLLSSALLLGAFGAFAQDTETNPLATYVLTPANGENLNEITDITLLFPEIAAPVNGNSTEAVDCNIEEKDVTLTNGTETYHPTGISYGREENIGISNRMFVFSFDKVDAEGEWTLTIPADAFTTWYQDQERPSFDSPAITAGYTISLLPPEDIDMNVYTITPTPDTEVTSLEKIMIDFPESGREGIGLLGGGQEIADVVYIRNLTTGKRIFAFNRHDHLNKDLEGNPDLHKCVIFFQKYGEGELANEFVPSITESGEYELVIPEKTFFAMVQYDMLPFDRTFVSPRITAKYKLQVEDSVESIENTADSFTVLDLSGRVLLRDAEPAALRTLDPGLYIVNGRKLIIK